MRIQAGGGSRVTAPKDAEWVLSAATDNEEEMMGPGNRKKQCEENPTKEPQRKARRLETLKTFLDPDNMLEDETRDDESLPMFPDPEDMLTPSDVLPSQSGSQPSQPSQPNNSQPPVGTSRLSLIPKAPIQPHKGLRALSLALVNKLNARGKVNCSDVADELALEVSNDSPPLSALLTEGQRAMDMPGYDKNVRRRVYDALNVLVAVGAIVKDGKFIEWKGIEHTAGGISKKEFNATKSRIDAKKKALKELKSQHHSFCVLGDRNRSIMLGNYPPKPTARLHFPLVVIKSPMSTEITLETTEDQQMMHFSFSHKFDIIPDTEIVTMLSNQTKLLSNHNFVPTSSSKVTMFEKPGEGLISHYPFISRSLSPLEELGLNEEDELYEDVKLLDEQY